MNVSAVAVTSPEKPGDFTALFTAGERIARRAFLGFFGLCVLMFLYREWVTLSTPIELFFDEAYYLSWAQHLDWGYYSKPPVVAWLIRLTTTLFGNAPWAVKLSAPLLYALTALLIYQMGSLLSGRRAALLAGLVFLFMPLVGFNSLFVTTDAPLLFFWALSTYCFLLALQRRRLGWWLTAGLAGGLGLLSKYTFILLPLTFLLYATVSELGRRVLAQREFWLACGLALCCLLPNLLWNYHHDFISFQHTAEISKQGEAGFDVVAAVSRLLEFFIGQMFVFGPVFAVLLLRRVVSVARSQSADLKTDFSGSAEAERFLWCLFLPCFAVLAVQALTARANINWAAPAYVAASLLAGGYLAPMARGQWLRVGLAFNIVLMLCFYHFALVTSVLGIERKQGTDPFKRTNGWRELAAQVQPMVKRYPDLPLLGSSRKDLAYFGYYLQPQVFAPRYFDGDSHINNHYELMYGLQPGDQQAYLYVGKWQRETLQSYFREVELLGQFEQPVYSNFSRGISVYRVAGLKSKAGL
jgi:4-amino-4-deoxy-L-arabinose transferase-like glycosyltransferase